MSDLDGSKVLDDLAEFIGRYVSFPSEHCLPVVALWAAHTHAVRCFYVTPRLVLDSAEPGSGKTRVLEVLNLVCADPEMTISVTPAAVFRLLDEKSYTLLFDEVDAIFNPKNGGNYEDLRALLNAGYKRGATIARCVGDAKAMKVQRFTVFSPVALAGLAGNMPATITTRAVTIHMRRRAAGETVEPFRERYAEVAAAPVRDALTEWISTVLMELRDAEPKLPDGVVDRPAEVWEALVAIADAAGGEWPDRARAACRFFVLDAAVESASLGQRLLADLRLVFAGRTQVATVEILEALVALEEASWGDMWGGKPLDARRLARELKRYEVAPVPFRDAFGKTVKGYTTYALKTKENTTAGLEDAWRRYLPPPPAGIQGNDGNEGNSAGQSALPIGLPGVTGVTDQDQVTPVTHRHSEGNARKGPLSSGVTAVTSVTQKPCRVCGFPLDPALAAAVHPTCEGDAA